MRDDMEPQLTRPIPDSYVVPGTLLAAGEYPGSPPRRGTAVADAKLAAFLDAGITAFVDLTDPRDPIAPYVDALRVLAAQRGLVLHYERLTIRDMSVCDVDHMRLVLDAIDRNIEAGCATYLHCWGGIGRTGMAVGCWLVRHGKPPDEALAEVERLFQSMSPKKVRAHKAWGSPQTKEQRAFVRNWARVEGDRSS